MVMMMMSAGLVIGDLAPSPSPVGFLDVFLICIFGHLQPQALAAKIPIPGWGWSKSTAQLCLGLRGDLVKIIAGN